MKKGIMQSASPMDKDERTESHLTVKGGSMPFVNQVKYLGALQKHNNQTLHETI
jgi:hypothetical protein